MNNYSQSFLELNLTCLGWSLIHFLWQGLLIVAVLEIVLGLVGPKNSSLRYVLCGLALAAMPVCLLVTYGVLGHGSFRNAEWPTVTMNGGSIQSIQVAAGQGLPASISQAPAGFSRHEIPSFELNRWMPEIVAAWLMGVLLLTARKAGGFIILWRLRRRGVSAPDDAISELFRQACTKIGIDPKRVCLKISTLVQVPMTMGWVRPVVLFPAVLLSGLSAVEIELLLAHELAHIRRYDYLVNLLQTVVETLFFYHPATWWISRRMRQERENCCDDLVTTKAKDMLAYAKVLVRLESMRSPVASLANAANGGNLLRRVQRLIGDPAPKSGMGLLFFFPLVGILVAITALSVVEAQTSANKPAEIPVASQ